MVSREREREREAEAHKQSRALAKKKSRPVVPGYIERERVYLILPLSRSSFTFC
jgi:hypothetical protein